MWEQRVIENMATRMKTMNARQGVSGGFDGIGRRDADRIIWESKQQARRAQRDARSGKRGFGNRADQEDED